MMLAVNEILHEKSAELFFRVLWLDESSGTAFLIDINNDNAIPIKRKVQDLKDELIIETLVKVKKDPFFSVVQQTPNEKNISIRDKAWSAIKDLVIDEPRIYEKHYRNKQMRTVLEKQEITYLGLRKYLKRYWQRGKSPNALLPDYHKSGAVGQERESTEKKRGRPRVYGGTGINIDDQTKKNFRFAIDKYFLTNKKLSLTKVYELMLKEFHAEDFYYDKGILKMQFEDDDKIPTESQFRYWYQKEYSIKEVIIAREGKRKYGKDHRELLSSATQEAYGPGSRFLIDATSANVYILSRDNLSPFTFLVGERTVFSCQEWR